MRRTVLSSAALLLSCASLIAAEVDVGKKSPTPTPQKAQTPKARQSATPASQASPSTQASPGPQASPGQPSPSGELPRYRPAMLGAGPASVINRIDTKDLIQRGQKDGSVMFCCSVAKTGEIANTWTYRGTPGSTLLEQELVKRLDNAVFVPGIYNKQ